MSRVVVKEWLYMCNYMVFCGVSEERSNPSLDLLRGLEGLGGQRGWLVCMAACHAYLGIFTTYEHCLIVLNHLSSSLLYAFWVL